MVLILDDEKEIIDLIEDVLEDTNLELFKASDVKDAVKIIKQGKIKVLITDISMPRINGIELMKKINEVSNDIKFICISAYSDIMENDLKEVGVQKVFKKPFDVIELKKSVITLSQ